VLDRTCHTGPPLISVKPNKSFIWIHSQALEWKPACAFLVTSIPTVLYPNLRGPHACRLTTEGMRRPHCFARVYNQLPAPYRHRHLYPFSRSRHGGAAGIFVLNAAPIHRSVYSLPSPGFIREMFNTLRTILYTALPTHGDPERLSSLREKKPSLLPTFSSFFSLVRRHPFLSSTVISVILTGVVAGVTNQSRTPDKRHPPLQIPPNENGASGFTGPSCVLTNHVSQIVLAGYGVNFDGANQKVEIAWEILGCGAYRLPTYPLPAARILKADVGCGSLNREIDIHFN